MFDDLLADAMKMIYVGTLSTGPDRDSSWIREFGEMGWDVVPFSSSFFTGAGILGKLQRRFNIGPCNQELQKNLLALACQHKPVWVHFRLPIQFDRSTILALRSAGSVVTQYFNDDPFSLKTPFGLHWKFRHALKAYDAHFVFRKHNILSFLKAGALHVEHCPPTYDPVLHNVNRRHPCGAFIADAAFIGHWENDHRVDYLEALHLQGFRVILKGGNWDSAIRNRPLRSLLPIHHAFGDDYNKIYSNVIAGLCFFSKINRDTWTRRALEIIAVGGVLVCERTQEAQTYFKDRKEAFFFSSISELLEIVKLLKVNPELRMRAQRAGYRRLLSGNYKISERARQIEQFVLSRLANGLQQTEMVTIS